MKENIYDWDLERLYEANDALSDQLQYYKEANDILSENLTMACKQRQEWRALVAEALLRDYPISLDTKTEQSQEESKSEEGGI